MANWQEEQMTAGGVNLQVFHGGEGPPLLALHGAGGNPGWEPYHDVLAEHFHVYAPSHPGFGASDRPDWLERVHDLAYVYRWFIDERKLGPLPVIGFSMGGVARRRNGCDVSALVASHGAGGGSGHETRSG